MVINLLVMHFYLFNCYFRTIFSSISLSVVLQIFQRSIAFSQHIILPLFPLSRSERNQSQNAALHVRIYMNCKV